MAKNEIRIHKVQAAEFRQNIKDIIRNLENGNDVYVLTHYNKVVGYLTHRIPPRIQGELTKQAAKRESVGTSTE